MKILPPILLTASLIIVVSLLLVPVFSSADCSKTGITVVYINGIFGTEDSAKLDKETLKTFYNRYGNKKNIEFINGYNESHAGGLDDLVRVVLQMYFEEKDGYDFKNILLQIHEQLNTQKVLLVGYSQGSFYSNAIYKYLIDNGVSKNAVAVYNIGTPADHVAGDGKYLTSSTDKVIKDVVTGLAEKAWAKRPLPANITLPIPESQKNDKYAGHYFRDNYMAFAADRIVSDIDGLLNRLTSGDKKDECFVKPKLGLSYYITGKGYYIVDNFGKNTQYLATAPYTPSEMANLWNALFQSIYGLGRDAVSSLVDLFNQVRGGAALTSALGQDNLNSSSGSSSSQSGSSSSSSGNSGGGSPNYTGVGGVNVDPTTEAGRQDLLDDIQERLDIINQQVQELVDQHDNNSSSSSSSSSSNSSSSSSNSSSSSSSSQSSSSSSSGGFGGSVSYPKILISEVQIDPVAQRFVELYNPNSEGVSLTGWYLQRKDNNDTSWNSFVSSTNFSGKIIPAGGYFIISRELASSDILLDITLSDDNSLALKNPAGEIVDKVGFGNAMDPETLATVNPSSGQSIGRKFSNGTEQDLDNNSLDFELDALTPKSQNTPYVPPVLTDTTAPQVSFTIDATQITADFSINFNITDPSTTVSPSGASQYLFRWQEEGGSWSEDLFPTFLLGNPISFTGSINFNGQDGKKYNFQMKTTDVAGNTSDWLPTTPATTTVNVIKKVLINEIQVSGTTADDEFIELYNPNNTAMDLAGFSLKKKNSSGTESILVSSASFTGTIPAGGYFLIVPHQNSDGSEKFTGSAVPNLHYSGASYYISSDNTILIYNNDGILLDKVGYGAALDYKVNPAEEPASGKSIQRKWDSVNNKAQDTGNNSLDFYTFDHTTPGLENPRYCVMDSVIFATDTTLRKDSCTYLFKNNSTVNTGVVLTIEPGTIIKFYSNAMLTVDGTINAVGNVYNKIIFTSFLDDEYGGDTNGDGNATTPAPNNWLSLYFTANSVNSNLEYAVVRYGGGFLWNIDNPGAAIKVNQSSIKLSNSVVEKNGNRGLWLINSPSEISSTQFSEQNTSDPLLGSGFAIQISGSTPSITNNYFSNNYSTILIGDFSDPVLGNSARPIIKNNNFENNWKVITWGGTECRPDLAGNTATGNTYNGIYFSTRVNHDLTLKADLPYIIQSIFAGTGEIPTGVKLTLEPGVILEFMSEGGLDVSGTLEAIGTSSNPIIFRPRGGATTPGAWAGIIFEKNSINSKLENVQISYSGARLFGVSFGSAIKVDQSVISLKNSTIQDSQNSGLWLVNSNSIIDSVQFLNHKVAETGYIAAAVIIQGGSSTTEIGNSSFTSQRYGIYERSWTNPDTSEVILPTPNLHDNTFMDSDVADIFTEP